MKKNKILLAIITIFIACGCELVGYETTNEEVNNYDYNQDNDISVYVDYKTCVEYLKLSQWSFRAGAGGLSVRYNADGTIKVNKECLKEKTKNEKIKQEN